MIFSRPVAPRATRTADMVASVPLDTQRSSSMLGKAARTASAPAVAPSPGRLLDATPYWGGDRIVRFWTDSAGRSWIGQCTVAVRARSNNSSAYYMLTAGHCGPTGTVWRQGYLDESDGTVVEHIGAASALAIACGDAVVVASHPVAV